MVSRFLRQTILLGVPASLRWNQLLPRAAVLCSLTLPACGESVPHTTFGIGGENVRSKADDIGNALDTLWVVDAEVLRADDLRQRLIDAAGALPPPNFGHGNTALLVAHAPSEDVTAPPTSCPPGPATAFTTRYCEEAGNSDNLMEYFSCAVAESAWKSSLPPLDALSEFLANNAPDARGRRLLSEGASLHVVIVALRDDEGFVSPDALAQQLIALKQGFSERVIVTLIAPTLPEPLRRSEVFRELLAGNFIDIAASAWDSLAGVGFVIGDTCVSQDDVMQLLVPNTDQCVAQALDFNASPRTTGVIQQCSEDHHTLPCWFVKNPTGCAQIKVDRGGCLPPPGSGIEVRCVANLSRP